MTRSTIAVRLPWLGLALVQAAWVVVVVTRSPALPESYVEVEPRIANAFGPGMWPASFVVPDGVTAAELPFADPGLVLAPPAIADSGFVVRPTVFTASHQGNLWFVGARLVDSTVSALICAAVPCGA
jgi:hypothetical protein